MFAQAALASLAPKVATAMQHSSRCDVDDDVVGSYPRDNELGFDDLKEYLWGELHGPLQPTRLGETRELGKRQILGSLGWRRVLGLARASQLGRHEKWPRQIPATASREVSSSPAGLR